MPILFVGLAATAARAEKQSEVGECEPRTRIRLQSSHFALYTDLEREAAEATLARMEAALDEAVRYWKRKPRGQIACYVAERMADWPDTALPHPLARVWVGGVSGATICDLERIGKIARARATVYAVASPGVAEHEVIHAYCCQTFGATGPDWYKEGMAQSLAHRAASAGQAGCPAELILALHEKEVKTARQIAGRGRFTKGINDSFSALLANRDDSGRHVPLVEWGQRDAETVRKAGLDYHRSWSLCHMLLENPNYATRFRVLGERYLSGRPVGFDDLFSAVADELAFEYEFYLRHMAPGYRVDLCRWDWQARFSRLARRATVSTPVEAARGYQASGLAVEKGRCYAYATDGAWATSAEGPQVGADGDDAGAGRLVGVIMTGFELGEPFDLGREGSFPAPASGNLYLRCRDAWDQLDDNRGQILARFTQNE